MKVNSSKKAMLTVAPLIIFLLAAHSGMIHNPMSDHCESRCLWAFDAGAKHISRPEIVRSKVLLQRDREKPAVSKEAIFTASHS
jgi:hypothetical protein